MNDLTIEQLKDLIKEASVEALNSDGGQKAVVNALNSQGGQKAMLRVLKSKEAKDIFIDNFVEAFHEVVVPILEDHDKRIKNLEQTANVV